MARRAFFSFHYENDVWRANIVRNSWVTKPDTEAAGFVDAADFEEVKKGGDAAIKKWIREQLSGTSVTVVLIGSETNSRDYIKYEWGHLLSKNQSNNTEKRIENLGLYSARCNQHIQSSMNIQELMLYGGIIAQRISNVLTKRRILFESEEWRQLISNLQE